MIKKTLTALCILIPSFAFGWELNFDNKPWTITETYSDGTTIVFEYGCHDSDDSGGIALHWWLNLGFYVDFEQEFYSLKIGDTPLCENDYINVPEWRCMNGRYDALHGSLLHGGEKRFLRSPAINLYRSPKSNEIWENYQEPTQIWKSWDIQWLTRAVGELKYECRIEQDKVGSHLKRMLRLD